MTEPHQVQPRILIVEDEQVVAADLERSLLDLGYDVLSIAETAKSAIRIAEQEHPDLVVMDIQLKGSVDGITAAEEIVARWQIPVVFVTANTGDAVLARARATGPYGYLIKPFRPKTLNATLLVALHQHRHAHELFSKHAWLRTILASLSDGVIATDVDYRVRYLNPVAEQLTGWTLADAQGKLVRDVFNVTTLSGEPVFRCQLERALADKGAVDKQRFLLWNKQGQKIPIEDSASPILELGRATGAVSIFLDITDILRREREAEEKHDRLEEQVQATAEALGQTRAELRALSAHLITAQEGERRRLARELHDDLGQRTAILEMQACRALEVLPEGLTKAQRLLHHIREQISELDGGVRRISHRLHPSVLEDLGLVPALRSLVDDFRQGGCDVSLRVPDRPPDLSLDVATAIYRIAQEALRNAMKHAPGAPARIALVCDDHELQLTIEDAGPGFDVAQARASGGLGLLSMQERARIAGGVLLLRTRPAEGTSISVRVPRGSWTSTT